ncbi:MAG: FAD-dependent thymidylate synthase [Candidatus Margulisbacteria bacterium]|nr:FAD-dependent thymidylate synthase [Candidatus Margulisiibacteriota bacterium]
MKVLLAGYNLDAEVIAELTAGRNRQDVTPETLSAAYARISRDPRPIDELRQIARQEVEKARRSNANIIFKMGHHSVAEHAVFNFDLIGVSRLALEELEKFRLCSYTEKSQRYQKLEGEYVIPEEIRGTRDEGRFMALIEKQNTAYAAMVGSGVEPEDARYITSLATTGQVGMTLNARNLELLVRRFASHSLAEIREIGRQIYELAARIAPSIVLFTAANDYDQKSYAELRAAVAGKWERKRRIGQPVVLVDYTAQADLKLLAALLHSATGVSYQNCFRLAKDLKKPARLALIKKANQYLEFYDAVHREYEHVSLTYDLIVSSSCFAQLKRHRPATVTAQLYDPALSVTVPPKIRGTRDEGRFTTIVAETDRFYSELAKEKPLAAQYLLTGAHRKRVLMTLNARELYHLARLREDVHAQWDIRELSARMSQYARAVMPLTMLLLSGKDSYAGLFEQVYGRPPKVLPPQE